jgi:hypothetical protein
MDPHRRRGGLRALDGQVAPRAVMARKGGCPSRAPPLPDLLRRWELSGHPGNPATRRLLHRSIQSGDTSPHSKPSCIVLSCARYLGSDELNIAFRIVGGDNSQEEPLLGKSLVGRMALKLRSISQHDGMWWGNNFAFYSPFLVDLRPSRRCIIGHSNETEEIPPPCHRPPRPSGTTTSAARRSS